METIIQVSSLTKSYKGNIVPALDGVNFTVREGEVFGLLGPNGAGKTTTISILSGLVLPSGGDISFMGMNAKQHLDEIKQYIGVVPQEIALFDKLTAKENLTFFGNMYGLKGIALRSRITSLLEEYDLGPHQHKLIRHFSGGMKRRLNLIAGLLHRPRILILDEPTVGVDVHSRSQIIHSLKNLNRQGTTIVYTSHHLEEASILCNTLAIMDQGKVIAQGDKAALLAMGKVDDLEGLFLQLTGRNVRDVC